MLRFAAVIVMQLDTQSCYGLYLLLLYAHFKQVPGNHALGQSLHTCRDKVLDGRYRLVHSYAKHGHGIVEDCRSTR